MVQSQAVPRGEAPRPLIAGRFGPLRGERRDARYQAFLLLWVAFVIAPILFGIDKFFNWMTDWPQYLWVGFPHFFGHVSSQDFLYVVGVIEIVAGVLVFLLPRFAPYVVAGWLVGIILNLVILSGSSDGGVYWDIALRDVGLFLAALALARLAVVYAPNPFRRHRAAPVPEVADAAETPPVTPPQAA
jgi:uncharacterized membrane protein YphA (DoxX/SURF4 family)